MFGKLTSGLIGLAILGLAGTANASVITYDESIDGDLPHLATASPVFALGVGTNTFSGEMTFSNAITPSDLDSFAFSVPSDASLAGISIDIALLPVGAGQFTQAGYLLQDSSFTTIDIALIPIPSTSLALVAGGLPLSSGQYALQHQFVAGALSSGQFKTAAYSFSLEVEDVPEPSALIFFAAGLTGLGFLTRRRKAV